MMTRPSMQAFLNLEPKLPERRRQVREAIGNSGSRGATIKEISSCLGWGTNRISGRLTELAEDGWIKDSGLMRNECTVWLLGDGTNGKKKRLLKSNTVRGRILNVARNHANGSAEINIRVPLFSGSCNIGESITVVLR